jgi:2Fe-2S ferredoxin
MNFTVTTREGTTLEVVEGSERLSVMEAIKRQGVDELLALCGGQLSCATCHVYIEESYLDRLPDMTDCENDLLDCSDHRRPGSRLACQIPCKADLAGCHVTIAPEDI